MSEYLEAALMRAEGYALVDIAERQLVTRSVASKRSKKGAPIAAAILRSIGSIPSDDVRYHVAQQSTSDPAGKVTGRES